MPDVTDAAAPKPPKRRFSPRRLAPLGLLTLLGPGLIAASAGNDAGGIATYSSIGAEFGYSLLWAMVLITVSLAVVQEMAARMGVVTGKGFSDLVREQFGVRPTAFVMATLVIANLGLVVSEFSGIGAAAELFGVSRYLAIPVAAVGLWGLILRGSYARVEKLFLLLTFVFFSYPIAAILAHPGWGAVLSDTLRPRVQFSVRYLTLFIAMVGTTITPYMQLYLQSAVGEKTGRVSVGEARADAYGGAVFSNVIAYLIIVATGATLFVSGETINTADDAARALRPFAGSAAPYIFGAGLFGASVLAAAVLPLATAYTVSEAFGFEKGVSHSFSEAPVFLGLFTALLGIGAAVAMVPGLNVIRLLVATQVVNGLVLPVVLVAIVLLINNPDIMGRHRNSRVYNVVSWVTVVFVVTLSTVYLAVTLLGLAGLV
ncbi:MAG: Nramp family divalent metal transporter [Thermomicrobiales bacterium]